MERYNNILSKKILVVGTVRNCESALLSNMEQLKNALSRFENQHWFLVESDSTDNTKTLLEAKKEVDGQWFNFLSLGNLEPTIPSRTERIAYCRNQYLHELRTNPLYQDVELLVVADLDNMQTLISEAGVLSCFDNDDWDVCTANQIGAYYDIWALRHEFWSPNDCWQCYDFLRKLKVNNHKALITAVYSRMIEIDPLHPLIEVDSAFGGLGIYKTQILKNASYIGKSEKNLFRDGMISEHVPFHETVRQNGGRIVVNPKMINTNSLNQHIEKAIPWIQFTGFEGA
ncbi:hypothetical protein ICN48_10870 [Polynucleobacter sp. JS-Safj-400b-B2]|uniref:hypothetical protein n=1 Tax=Polynucleobacter sp. JS-Safj-400b-B2 TaxID=2576921 RepID=UPI001C0BB8C2|nr:hypothetical protein [Polynucleobacter sp. JS-Safj-400b-B2]MBU3626733.1 hypothetical protein [Polynucleobacter sp. JS-Safj-400b-B2]